MKLLPGEAEVLRNVCDTIFPSIDGGSPFLRRSASDMSVDLQFSEAIDTALQPGAASDLRRVLRVLDSRAYNLALTGRPVRFTSMNRGQRERYLQAWRDSPIGLKRTAFQALKRLTCFIAYAYSPPDGPNPNWADIGYPG
ncbi:MAG: gluconate 2-dehydrogenase subunit 3 family protein, partial [Candidatus Gagatemarchaeaceae archaeon]